ncbi:hypothetical protein FJY90_04485 [Candidatus Gottesmanbacteria bacterium]|nr:hypothetical protein [Candidatus Gottesmanbacteria bacterium]
MISYLLKAIIYAFFFLFPLFYLPITSESYEYNKMALLLFVILVSVFLYSLKAVSQKSIIIIKSSFGTLLALLGAIALISTFLQSPNPAVSLATPLSATTLSLAPFLYLLLVYFFHNLEKSGSRSDNTYFLTIFVFNSILLSIFVILLYTGFLPKSQFTPAGNLLSTTMYLSVIAVYLISYLINYFLTRKAEGENSKLKSQNAKLSVRQAQDPEYIEGQLKTQNLEERETKPKVSILETDLIESQILNIPFLNFRTGDTIGGFTLNGFTMKGTPSKGAVRLADEHLMGVNRGRTRKLESGEKLDTEALYNSEKFVSEELPNKDKSDTEALDTSKKSVSGKLRDDEQSDAETLPEPENFTADSSSSIFIFYLISLVIIILALILLVFHLLTDQKPLILPFLYGWSIFLEVAKNLRTLLLGVGPANFITAFTLTKPLSFNYAPFWNVIFTSSSSFVLNLATEIGAISALIYLFLLLKSLKLLTAVNQQAANKLPCLLSLIFALILQLVLPGNMSVFILTVILFALASEKKEIARINLSPLKRFSYLLILPVMILIIIVIYFSGRAYLAEVVFKKSLDALLNNQGKQAYDLQNQAISLNPFIDRYRLVYSQTNLALANALAAKQDLTNEDKQNIPRLVQQSIDQARSAVILYRTNSINWDNLGKTYSALSNFASGAQDWAITSYQQKILLDPLNPNNYLVLGKIYLNLKKYPEAQNHFSQAIKFKEDFANARYNLSIAYREQQKYQEAYQELQATAALLTADSLDAQKVAQEISELARLLPAKESTPSSQPETPSQPQVLEETVPSPNDLINPLAPVSTIALPQPPVTP